MGNESATRGEKHADLLSAYQQAVRSLAGDRLVAKALQGRLGSLTPRSGGRRTIVGLGKAAGWMARGAISAFPDAKGAVAVPSPTSFPDGVVAHLGGHPIPDERSGIAGRALLDLAASLGPMDMVLFLISGGGSSIASVPAPGITLSEKARAARALIRSGAPIDEVNTIRKHLSAIKGGWLGVQCRAGKALGLVISDVASGSMDTVASGPTLPDPTTYEQCLEIVKRRDPGLPDTVVARLARGAAGKEPETPKPGDSRLSNIEHELLAGPPTLVRAAVSALEGEGLRGIPMEAPLAGDVAEVAKRMGEEVRAVVTPCVLVFCGEPTVRPPPGSGRGGRMQHLALLLARDLAGRSVRILAAGSDGRDGETDYAGAVVDGDTYRPAAEAIDRAIARFDATPTCVQLHAAIAAWETGTNLTDLVLVAVD